MKNETMGFLLNSIFNEVITLSRFEYEYQKVSNVVEAETDLSWILENYGVLYSKSGFFQMYWKKNNMELHYQSKTSLKENSIHLIDGIVTQSDGKSFIPDLNYQYEGQLRVIHEDDEKTYKKTEIDTAKDNTHWREIISSIVELLHKKNSIYKFTTQINKKIFQDETSINSLIDETLNSNPSEEFWLKMVSFISDNNKMELFIKHLVYDNGINIFDDKHNNLVKMLEIFFINNGYSSYDWEKRKEKINELIISAKRKERLEKILINNNKEVVKKTKI